MRPTFWQRVDSFARHLVPFGLTVLFILLSMLPSHVPGMVRIGPMLPLAAVYYWSVHRPDLMGAGMVFAIGLLDDLLNGAPLGTGALTLLLLHGIVSAQIRFISGRSFGVTWLVFMVLGAIAVFLKWLAVSLVHGALVAGLDVFYSYLMTVALYPPTAWLLSRAQSVVIHDHD